jgi:hypothetical protein
MPTWQSSLSAFGNLLDVPIRSVPRPGLGLRENKPQPHDRQSSQRRCLLQGERRHWRIAGRVRASPDHDVDPSAQGNLLAQSALTQPANATVIEVSEEIMTILLSYWSALAGSTTSTPIRYPQDERRRGARLRPATLRPAAGPAVAWARRQTAPGRRSSTNPKEG